MTNLVENNSLFHELFIVFFRHMLAKNCNIYLLRSLTEMLKKSGIWKDIEKKGGCVNHTFCLTDLSVILSPKFVFFFQASLRFLLRRMRR